MPALLLPPHRCGSNYSVIYSYVHLCSVHEMTNCRCQAGRGKGGEMIIYCMFLWCMIHLVAFLMAKWWQLKLFEHCNVTVNYLIMKEDESWQAHLKTDDADVSDKNIWSLVFRNIFWKYWLSIYDEIQPIVTYHMLYTAILQLLTGRMVNNDIGLVWSPIIC